MIAKVKPRRIMLAIEEAHALLSALDGMVEKTDKVNEIIVRLRFALDRASDELANVRIELRDSIEKL